jgi:hypothetical protein
MHSAHTVLYIVYTKFCVDGAKNNALCKTKELCNSVKNCTAGKSHSVM